MKRKYKEFEFYTNGINGSSPSIWAYLEDINGLVPLVYFRKPKWMSKDEFQSLMDALHIQIDASWNQ